MKILLVVASCLLLLFLGGLAFKCVVAPPSAEIHNEASSLCKSLLSDEKFRAYFIEKGITINDIKHAAGNCRTVLCFYTRDDKKPDAAAMAVLLAKVKDRKFIGRLKVKFFKGTPGNHWNSYFEGG